VARELIDAIDALVSFVKKNEGRDFPYPEWTRDNLHVLGMEVQTLAEELGLASPGEPVYSTAETCSVHTRLGKGNSLTGICTTNPTWPGEAYVKPLMGMSFSAFFLTPSMAWYKRFETLRKKALKMCGGAAGAGETASDARQAETLVALPVADKSKIITSDSFWKRNKDKIIVEVIFGTVFAAAIAVFAHMMGWL